MRLTQRKYASLAVAAFALTLFSPPARHSALPAGASLDLDHDDAIVEHESGGHEPSDWFAMQRSFPGETINRAAYLAALAQAQNERANQPLRVSSAGAIWQQAGPFNIGGRVTALAVAPGGTTAYLGSANGGVYKTDDGGVNWSPLMDNLGVFSIGSLALDPADPNVVYCGTGESNASVDSYDGAGLFRSTDAGQSWTYIGLQETARIARVAVDPSNANRILVAAMGTQFSTNSFRGLYRSEDHGLNWSKVLSVSDSTGVCDVLFNPSHPETVFCATWERVRHNTYRRAFGPEGGIWRSIDSGTTWTKLTSGLPTPSDNLGRIALGIAPSKPTTVYAQIITGAMGNYNGLGFYRTIDGGNTWTKRDATGFTGIFGGFGWYFGDLGVDPVNPDKVYAMGVDIVRCADGGRQLHEARSPPALTPQSTITPSDRPANTNHILLGNDGGFWSTTLGGSTWTHAVTLPITQFYAGAVDPNNPARLVGGTQDNNTVISFGSPNTWSAFLGGDGFYCLIDPTNSNVRFAEWQYCCDKSGLRRFGPFGTSSDTVIAPSGFVGSDRYTWCTPIVMNPKNHNQLLVGASASIGPPTAASSTPRSARI